MKKLLVSTLFLTSFLVVQASERKSEVDEAALLSVLAGAATSAFTQGYQQTRGTETFKPNNNCKRAACGTITCVTVSGLCLTGHPCCAAAAAAGSFAVAKELGIFEQPKAQETLKNK
jgi:hypothetical protein